MLTHERLLSVLTYDAELGTFTWKRTARSLTGRRLWNAGKSAGWIEASGYGRLTVDGRTYLAHRLAWFYVHGAWPIELDHRNGDPGDYRMVNLRELTHQENSHNLHGAHADSQTGILGVQHRGSRWTSTIMVGGKRIHLGTFRTADEARAAYIAAKREHHPAWEPKP